MPLFDEILQLQLICNNAEPDPVAGCRDQGIGGMEDVRGVGVAWAGCVFIDGLRSDHDSACAGGGAVWPGAEKGPRTVRRLEWILRWRSSRPGVGAGQGNC